MQTLKRTVLAVGFSSLAGILAFSAHASPSHSNLSPAKAPEPISWSEIGARAGADYKGNGLSVAAAENGAQLRCLFQRLDGEATREGLWLISTVPDAMKDRFRVVASAVGRQTSNHVVVADCSQLKARSSEDIPTQREHRLRRDKTLPRVGTVSVDLETVRFSRPGLIEEYMVDMDGVRQDFVMLERPEGEGNLRLELMLSGARVEHTAHGARLVLENSRRKIAYSRLKVTDVTGRVLGARIDVESGNRIAVLVNDAEAVYPMRVDPTFSDENWTSLGGIPGANFAVYAAVVDGFGNLYIGGDFTLVGETIAGRIARWNGSSWSALGSGMNDRVRALVVSGSDMYAGGDFTTAGGNPANYIAKWNGSSWATLGSGMNNQVHAMAVSGSVLYAGGYFTTAGGTPANRIAKWNGNSWSAFGTGMDDGVSALAVSGNNLYAGGRFTTAGGVPVNYVARWNGSNWSALGPGMNSPVLALAVSGNELYAGGGFWEAGGVRANYVARWNGGSWSALGPGMISTVHALAVSGSDLYAGGSFRAAGDGPADRIAKWNGSSWSPVGLGAGMDDTVHALAVLGSDLYVGGSFRTAGGRAASHVAKWNGNSWSTLGWMSDFVRALVVSGTNLYAAGAFREAGGAIVNRIAKWNGNSWSALGSGLANGIHDQSVHALALSGTNLYAGGDFRTAGGTPASHIAKWNGNSWSALGSGMNNIVFALAASGNDLYAGGYFTTAGGVTVNHIAKWNGSSWSALGSGLSSDVYALAVSGGALYAGGFFTTAGGITVNGIAKWNGSSWSALGTGVINAFGAAKVDALAVSGSDLYAGGWFTTAGGTPANRIAKWNGSSWSALGGLGEFVFALAVSGTDLYAGGSFREAGGVTANGIAKWNGSSWSALGTGVDHPLGAASVYALAVSGNDLYVGGSFIMAGDKPSAYLAKAVIAATTNCSFAISPTNGFFSAAGGSTNVVVTVSNGCSWTASSPCPWVTVIPSSGTGSSMVTITITNNAGSPSRECQLTIARQTFAVTQSGVGSGLKVTIATNLFTAAPGHFKLVAPTNTINLQAIVTGNTNPPIFQWCRESTNESGKVVHDGVIFTNPNSSNTTVIFDYAGTYKLSVTASDGVSNKSASVMVDVELNPSGDFDITSISNLLYVTTTTGATVNSNKFLTYGGFFGVTPNVNGEQVANAYYEAIDPSSDKTTFEDWKVANGITNTPPPSSTGTVVSATYFNALDLGLGRRMIMKTNSNGDAAFAVSNYTNVNDAVIGTGLIATVAMEYSSVTNGGPRFTKFYVFGADGNRVNRADLDGAGEKYLPGLCIVCHGGQTFQTIPYANSGNVDAHFLPFDLRAFDYSCDPAFSKAAQQSAFRELNRGVLQIERSLGNKPAITNLIEGWYGGPTLPSQTQDEDFVPDGWKDTNQTATLNLAGQAYLYHSVVAPACRSCHVTRSATSTGSFAPADFRRSDHFDFWRVFIASDVFGTFDTNSLRAAPILMTNNAFIKMPHARRTFERFWNSISPRPQPEILREYLLGRLNEYLTPTSSITAIQRIGSDLQISFTTSNRGSYRLERTDELAPPISSTPLHGPVSGTGGTNQIIHPIEAGQLKRFFRVRSLP